MTHGAEPLKVARVLMHRDVYDAEQYGEDPVESVLPLLILDVLVPERVGEEVETHTLCTPIKQPGFSVSCNSQEEDRGSVGGKGCANTGRGFLVQTNHDPSGGSVGQATSQGEVRQG